MNEVVKEINYALSIFGQENELPVLKIRAVLWTGTAEELKEHISQQSTMVIFGSTKNVSNKAKELYPDYYQGEFPTDIYNPEVSSMTTKIRLPRDKNNVFMDSNIILVKSETFSHKRAMNNIYHTTPEDALKAIASTVIHGLGHNSGMEYLELGGTDDRGHDQDHKSIMTDGSNMYDAIEKHGKGDVYNLIRNADKNLHKKISDYFYRTFIPNDNKNRVTTPIDNTRIYKKESIVPKK